MRQRTREHELETLSKRDFATRVPVEWVEKGVDAADDYGIDRAVAIFDEGRPTGLEFYVQLKATDRALPDALRIALDVKHRDHYAALALPVLMCRFHAPTGRMFAKWFHAYDPHYAVGEAGTSHKTFTFRWHETDEWRADTPERLKAEVAAFRRFREAQLRFPLTLHVQADAANVLPAEAVIILRSLGSAVGRVVRFEQTLYAPGEPTLRFEADRILVSFAGVASVSLHRTVRPGPVTPDLAADAVVTVGLALLQIGRPDAAADLITAVGASAPSLFEADAAGGAYAAFAASGKVLDGLALSRAFGAMGTDASELTEAMLALAALGSNVSEPARDEYRAVMTARAERRLERGDKTAAGADFYNIANSYRSSRRPRDAIRNYVRCARLDPTYRERPYFNAELGGMLFMTDHFELAAAFYGRALALDSSNAWTAGLYADALMYAGRYLDAEHIFRRKAEANAEWRLKGAILPIVRRATKADVQQRGTAAAASRPTAALEADSLEAAQEMLREAIARDGLSDAWYWLALTLAEASPKDAAESMLIAALARRHDPNAWVWAFVLEWSAARRDDRLVDIATTGLKLSDDFRGEILEWARADEQASDREAIMNLLARGAALNTEESTFTVRIGLESGLEEFQLSGE